MIVLSSPKSSAATRCEENGSDFEVTSAIRDLFTWIFQAIFEPSSAVTFCVFFVSLAGSFVYSGGVTITSARTSAG